MIGSPPLPPRENTRWSVGARTCRGHQLILCTSCGCSDPHAAVRPESLTPIHPPSTTTTPAFSFLRPEKNVQPTPSMRGPDRGLGFRQEPPLRHVQEEDVSASYLLCCRHLFAYHNIHLSCRRFGLGRGSVPSWVPGKSVRGWAVGQGPARLKESLCAFLCDTNDMRHKVDTNIWPKDRSGRLAPRP